MKESADRPPEAAQLIIMISRHAYPKGGMNTECDFPRPLRFFGMIFMTRAMRPEVVFAEQPNGHADAYLAGGMNTKYDYLRVFFMISRPSRIRAIDDDYLRVSSRSSPWKRGPRPPEPSTMTTSGCLRGAALG